MDRLTNVFDGQSNLFKHDGGISQIVDMAHTRSGREIYPEKAYNIERDSRARMQGGGEINLLNGNLDPRANPWWFKLFQVARRKTRTILLLLLIHTRTTYKCVRYRIWYNENARNSEHKSTWQRRCSVATKGQPIIRVRLMVPLSGSSFR